MLQYMNMKTQTTDSLLSFLHTCSNKAAFLSQAPDWNRMRSFQWLCLWLLLSLHSDEPVSTDVTQMRPWEDREARAGNMTGVQSLPLQGPPKASQVRERTTQQAQQGSGSQDSYRKPSGEAGGSPAGSAFTFLLCGGPLAGELEGGVETGSWSQALVGCHCPTLWHDGSTQWRTEQTFR